jgi:hypothetical protein
MEISRIATGRKCGLCFEINGSKGSLVFDQERMNEIRYYASSDASDRRGFRTVLAGPEHADYGAFCPASGHGLGTYPEAITLASIAAPKNVRLACQVRPDHSITVTRLLRPASTGPQAVDVMEADAAGAERPLAVMFLDLREFTQLSQSRLPYDVVFILNEFFAATGSAIHTYGGWIDKFLGDGLLAIFGQHHGVEAGCRQALRATRAIDLALDHVNAKLAAEIGRPLRVGMGIHAGPLLLGRSATARPSISPSSATP